MLGHFNFKDPQLHPLDSRVSCLDQSQSTVYSGSQGWATSSLSTSLVLEASADDFKAFPPGRPAALGPDEKGVRKAARSRRHRALSVPGRGLLAPFVSAQIDDHHSVSRLASRNSSLGSAIYRHAGNQRPSPCLRNL